MANVREIMVGWLREHGYDGLWCPAFLPGYGDPNEASCVCSLDNLMDPGEEGFDETDTTALKAPCQGCDSRLPRHTGEHEEVSDGAATTD